MKKKPLRIAKQELKQFADDYSKFKQAQDEYLQLSISQKQLSQALDICFTKLTQTEGDVNKWTTKWEEAFGTDAEINIETGEVKLPKNA